MAGLEVTTWAGSNINTPRAPDPFCNPSQYIDRMARIAAWQGVRRVRLEIRAGAENDTDWYDLYRSGSLPYRDDSNPGAPAWRNKRYSVKNDNTNPSVMNPAGFHFTELDETIDLIVKPLKREVEALGEPFHINLTYVGAPVGDPASEHHAHRDNPDEYAEFMRATFDHMDAKYGFVPDTIEPYLEIDEFHWHVDGWARSIKPTAQRLADTSGGARAYHPGFAGPTHANTALVVNALKKLETDYPDVLPYLVDLTYHRYGGDPPSILTELSSLAAKHGLRTAQTEWVGEHSVNPPAGTLQAFFDDLVLARNSFWSPYIIGSCFSAGTPGAARDISFVYADRTKPGIEIGLGRGTQFAAQVFRELRVGAVRKGVTPPKAGVRNIVAFVNPNGKWVVSAECNDQPFTIGGLAAGQYGMFWSWADRVQVPLPDVTVAAGEPVRVPAGTGDRLITVFQR